MAFPAAWFLLLVFVGLSACSPVLRAGTRENFDAHHRASLARRAGFELGCAETDLSFTPLGDGDLPGGDYTTVGVMGCGKRASYQLLRGKWLLTQPVRADEGAPAAGEQRSSGSSQTAAELTRYVMKSPDVQVLIEPRKPEGPGFGKTNVSMERRPVWPPSGPTCDELAACCEQHLAADSRFELLCPFAVVRHPGDCAAALGTVNQIGFDLGVPRAGACKLP